MKNLKPLFIVMAMLVGTASAHAASHGASHGTHGTHGTSHAADPATSGDAKKDSATAASADMTDGEIRKVDKDTKKITLKHGEIKNLDMPPMTMVFQVKDPALLDKVKAGDKVRFKAEKVGGAFVVTDIQPVK